MPRIKTQSGNIQYKLHPLFPGVKQINKSIAKENLLLLKKKLDLIDIQYGLIAGTLLGAVREKDFIDHDEDIDLFFFDEDRERVFDIVPQLKDNGFEIARYDCRGMMSVMRKGEYIDFYFFSKFNNELRGCCGWLIPKYFLENTALLKFQGAMFIVPKDYVEYLKFEYGYSWFTPIAYFNFKEPTWKIWLYKIKENIKTMMPDRLFLKLSSVTEEAKRKKSYRKLERYNELCKESGISSKL